MEMPRGFVSPIPAQSLGALETSTSFLINVCVVPLSRGSIYVTF